MGDLPELPEGYIWRVAEYRRRKDFVALDGYSLSVVDSAGDCVISTPIMEDPVARRKLDELAKAVDDAEQAYFRLRQGWFSKAKAMKAGAYDAYRAARTARSEYRDGLDLAAKDLTPEVILHNANLMIHSTLQRIEEAQAEKARQEIALEAAERSARFVGDYPPLSLKLGAVNE